MKHSHLKDRLYGLKFNNRFRESRTLQNNGYQIADNSSEMTNFSGNDYLGLAGDANLQARFFEYSSSSNTQNWMAASSSRALTGTSPAHNRLEKNIARSYRKERALIFNSGYHANSGILPVITTPQDLIVSDELIHASMIDGIRLSKAKRERFTHNSLEHLEQVLTEHAHNFDNVWIVTESLFSMDGDYVPLEELIQLKNRFGAYLYLDEAHAVGCLGENGLGFAEALGLIEEVDLLVGTFGKALAGYGGYAVGDQVLIETMENFARSWIFSTALPPINMDWNNFVWERLAQFSDHRERLAESTHRFREGLGLLDEDSLSATSHIVPLIKPGNKTVVEMAAKLEQVGILALPIRSPTVAVGQERIRFSLTADIPVGHIQRCIDEVKRAL